MTKTYDLPSLTIHLIRKKDTDGEGLWWSNEGYWAPIEEALVWSTAERNGLALEDIEPIAIEMGGEWVSFNIAEEDT